MTVLPTVESRILRLFDFGLACKRLFLLYLRCRLSGSNSVGRMPASPLPPFFSVIYVACCLPCCPLRCGSQERYCVASQHRQTHQDERALEDVFHPRSEEHTSELQSP